jgi:peptidyl-prolyl cis-trans isomerase B (cyclophilin B)
VFAEALAKATAEGATMRLVRVGVIVGIIAGVASLAAAQGTAAQPGAKAQAAQPAAKPPADPAPTSPGAGPVVVVETEKGTFEFETYPNEAPKTVAHILGLVKKRFYNGMRVHRMVPNFVVQMGDPLSRDMSQKDMWGTGGSGTKIGAGEVSKLRTHVRGAVGIAYAKDPRNADSQFYVTLSATPQLNAEYTVFGKVISGMDVVTKLAIGDRIARVTIRGEGRK